MDALLMFDVLMYLNLFYYPLAAICHPVMIIAKFYSINYSTTSYIARDVVVVMTMTITDLIKILSYRKIREHRRVIAVIVAVLFSSVTFACIVYIGLIQEKPTKMEYIFSSITALLYLFELIFGILQFFPCCKKTEYQ